MFGFFILFNLIIGKCYKGINVIQFMVQGYVDLCWMIYKQVVVVGVQVCCGEKGMLIQYWKFSEEQIKIDEQIGKLVFDVNGDLVKVMVQFECLCVFFVIVFNVEQIDGLLLLECKEQIWSVVEWVEYIFVVLGVIICYGEYDCVFYWLFMDSIYLFDKGQFLSVDNYYVIVFYELGYWIGYLLWLDCDLVYFFGSEGYVKEELWVEIVSMILGDELGIGYDFGQYVVYVGLWIKVL